MLIVPGGKLVAYFKDINPIYPTYLKPSSQHSFVSNDIEDVRSTASVILDKELNVISISKSYFDLYKLNELPFPTSLQEVVQAQKEGGWFALTEAFSDNNIFEALLHKLKNNQYFHDFHFSLTGEVIDVAHYTDPESGNTFFNYTPTAASVAPASEKSFEIRALLVLRDLVKLGMFGLFPIAYNLIQTEGLTYVPLIIDPKTGKLITFDNAKDFQELKNIHFVKDLSLNIRDITNHLDNNEQYSCSLGLEGEEPLQLILKRQFFYSGGPNFLSGKIMRLSGGVTKESVMNEFPIFSSKEAEVVCLLAHGHTIKESAAKTGKAQVTVSLQARSAQHKSGERSINALIARITNSRPQYL
jgi:hypothetical protein